MGPRRRGGRGQGACPHGRCVSAATLYNRYKGSIYLVFDFCEHDLAGLLSNSNVKFTLAEIKKVMQMLLNGLYYIHRNKVPPPTTPPRSVPPLTPLSRSSTGT